jgi:hypothetical protein
MIIDPDDQIWKDYFTLAELNEIKSFNINPLKNIPEELESYLDLYDKEWENGLDLYEFADSKKHHPIKEFEKKMGQRKHDWSFRTVLSPARLGTKRLL